MHRRISTRGLAVKSRFEADGSHFRLGLYHYGLSLKYRFSQLEFGFSQSEFGFSYLKFLISQRELWKWTLVEWWSIIHDIVMVCFFFKLLIVVIVIINNIIVVIIINNTILREAEWARHRLVMGLVPKVANERRHQTPASLPFFLVEYFSPPKKEFVVIFMSRGKTPTLMSLGDTYKSSVKPWVWLLRKDITSAVITVCVHQIGSIADLCVFKYKQLANKKENSGLLRL